MLRILLKVLLLHLTHDEVKRRSKNALLLLQNLLKQLKYPL